MKKTLKKIIAVVFLVCCSTSFSQSYEFDQGYIFEQEYIKRIPLEDAEELSGVSGVFNEFLSWDWPPEKITNSLVERAGSRMIIKFENKPALTLRDFSTKEGDGEAQLFRYLKSVPGYHVIGVVFGHDQPAFLLIHESGSDLYFVDTH